MLDLPASDPQSLAHLVRSLRSAEDFGCRLSLSPVLHDFRHLQGSSLQASSLGPTPQNTDGGHLEASLVQRKLA